MFDLKKKHKVCITDCSEIAVKKMKLAVIFETVILSVGVMSNST